MNPKLATNLKGVQLHVDCKRLARLVVATLRWDVATDEVGGMVFISWDIFCFIVFTINSINKLYFLREIMVEELKDMEKEVNNKKLV